MISTEDMGHIQVNVILGVSKEDSPYVVDEETAQFYDDIAAEIAEIKKNNPNAIIDCPTE